MVKAGTATAKGGASAKARGAAAAAREALHARLRQASWAARSATEERPEAKGSVLRAAADASHSGPGGVAWGSLIHGLLEHAVRHAGATRPDLERLARWLTVETLELRPFVTEAVDLVEGIRGASFWREVRDAGAVHVEVPFAVRLEAGQVLGSGDAAAMPTIVHGVIDLAYDAQDGWRILDYKTDRLPSYDPSCDGIVLARHGAQLAQYRAAWERVTGVPVSAEGIVLVRGGRTAWRR